MSWLVFLENSRSQNRPSFPHDRATPPTPLSFASQKRPLAFYSSMENAPFGVNRAESAYFKKVCNTASFFAGIPEMDRPDRQTGAL